MSTTPVTVTTAGTPVTAQVATATPGTADSTVNNNIKYVIVGIDNQTGSINYIREDSDTIVDSANREKTPYSIFNDESNSNSDSITYVKFKVQKSSTQPLQNSDGTKPYFELNKSWYTLLLDQHVSPRETSGIVTKEWFGDHGLDKDPFSIFKRRFYNTELVLKNLKYLFNLPPEECNFNDEFKEIDQSKNGTFEEIQKALIRPFFAIKTFLDMGDSRYIKDNRGDTVELFFTSGRDRYGYPNIKGDKSAIIAALQMLYDVRNRCPNCVDTTIPNLSKLLTHIYAQHYFLKKDENEANIGDFEADVTTLEPGFNPSDPNILAFLKKYTTGTSTTPPTNPQIEVLGKIPDDLSVLKGNLVIIESDKTLPKLQDYILVGEISQLRDLDQYIYSNYEIDLLFNDVEIRKLESNPLQYLAKPTKISLYRKKGTTYRELLMGPKYNISKENIDRTLKGNRFVKFIDYFLSDNPVENEKYVTDFMNQYLSDQSKIDLDLLIGTKFTGLKFRHGICNYSGKLSHFTAAMQLAYDCCLYKSGITYRYNIFAVSGSVNPDVRMSEFELLNIEYCLERIFENIQTNLQQRNTDPRQIDTTPLGLPNSQFKTPVENYFYNYKICADFIVKSNNAYSKLMLPDKGARTFSAPEFRTENLINNYFYRRFAKNILNLDEKSINDSRTTAKNAADNKWDYASGAVVNTMLTPLLFIGYAPAAIALTIGYLNYNRRGVNYENKTNDEIQKAVVEELRKKGVNIPAGFSFSDKSLPLILNNSCVQIIHQLILVLFRNFNVFIDFEDDLRSQAEKIKEFKDDTKTSSIQTPNFVIKIGSLPRENLADETPPAPPASGAGSSTSTTTGTSGAGASISTATPAATLKNYIKITGFPGDHVNAEYTNGVYYPHQLADGTQVYKHSDHNKIYLKKVTTATATATATTWQIYFDAPPAPPAPPATTATSTTPPTAIATSTADIFTSGTTWSLKKELYTNGTDSTMETSTYNINAEYIGAWYIPKAGDKITITPEITPLATEYELTTTSPSQQYETVGTIYKSIHHDFVYKYYNHEHRILFTDCRADYDIEGSKLDTFTAGMFPFIRLYRKLGFTYPTDTTNVIYADAIKWSERKTTP